MIRRIETSTWIYYFEEEKIHDLLPEETGKWMYFFNDKTYAERMCKSAVETGVVATAKCSNGTKGVSCFYLNAGDVEGHKQVISFFVENHLIPKTKTGRFYNISFKFDTQTSAGIYGKEFVSDIKLERFINLETGEWIYNGSKFFSSNRSSSSNSVVTTQFTKSEHTVITTKTDSSNLLIAILSALFPPAGFVLYFFWKEDHPLRASSCFYGAWFSIVVILIYALSKNL